MTTDHAIYKLLSTALTCELSALQVDTIPSVYFKSVSSPASDDSPNRWERWRFFIKSDSFTEVQDILETIRTTLNNGGGTVEDGADSLYIDRIEALEYGTTPEWVDAYYISRTDYRVIVRRD